MSKFFTPVELPEKPRRLQQAEPEEDWPKTGSFDVANDRLAKLFNDLQTGGSNLSHYALELNHKTPTMVSFRRFKKHPTKENMETFLTIVEQDLPKPVGDKIQEILAIVFAAHKKEKTDE